MSKVMDPKNVDRRLVSRFVSNGQLDEAAYDKFLKSLPDLADKAETISTTISDDETDGDLAEA